MVRFKNAGGMLLLWSIFWMAVQIIGNGVAYILLKINGYENI
tara:strand:- start:3172 stop:3297 length:126 start_codon:yes stop_codon:yes gene_type:complete